MQDISCIICGKNDNQVLIEENGYKGKKCSQCGLIYVSPRPSFNEIIDIYGHDNAHISAESHIASAFSKRLNARDNLRIIHSEISSGDLLEIGAGAGYFLDEARKVGFNPYGLEFNPIQADFIRSKLNIPCEESSLSSSIFGGRKFDVVYHCNVISHFYDPISEFFKINEVLQENGYVIFETGNLGEIDSKYFEYVPRFQFPDHLFFFNTDNIKTLLVKTGFEIVKIHRYSILPQLISVKALNQIASFVKKHIIKPTPSKSHPPKENVSLAKSETIETKPKASSIKSFAGNLIEFFMYILRCKVGRLLTQKHHPQTIIVVAKKV